MTPPALSVGGQKALPLRQQRCRSLTLERASVKNANPSRSGATPLQPHHSPLGPARPSAKAVAEEDQVQAPRRLCLNSHRAARLYCLVESRSKLLPHQFSFTNCARSIKAAPCWGLAPGTTALAFAGVGHGQGEEAFRQKLPRRTRVSVTPTWPWNSTTKPKMKHRRGHRRVREVRKHNQCRRARAQSSVALQRCARRQRSTAQAVRRQGPGHDPAHALRQQGPRQRQVTKLVRRSAFPYERPERP